MNKHTLYYNLRDAFAEEGCPICRLCSQAVDRYLDHLLYESVNDPGVRRNIRRSWGFCKEHAWQLQQKGDALGIAIIYQDVIATILRTLSRAQKPGLHFPTHWLRRALPGAASEISHQLAKRFAPAGECPACLHRAEVEYAYLETLLQHHADPELISLWRASNGLCWPHFQQALQLVQDEATFHLLIDMELAHLSRLCSELREFIRHHDYHFVDQGFGSEGDSWIRAIAKVSGWRNQH